MQKIESVEHACEVLGQTIDFDKIAACGLPEQDTRPLIDYYKITKIIEATNKLNKWTADWSNSSQWKYCVYKEISKDATKPSGFGFSVTDYVGWGAVTAVGSRLCVGSSEEALYIGEKFEALFESAWLIIKPKE